MRGTTATRPPCGLLIAVALSGGAILGNALQFALRQLDIDPALAWKDFFVAGVAQTQSALAWWAWCLVVALAFVVAYSTTLRINHPVRRRKPFGLHNWFTVAAFVLGLSLTIRLVAGSDALDPTGHLIVSLAVVVLPALAAGIGAQLACRAE
jgi:hypothetical protein